MKSSSKGNILIGITAGIAGYKIAKLLKILKGKGYQPTVIMTENAIKMFGRQMFEEKGVKVFHKIIPENFNFRPVLKNKKVEHIALSDSADLLIIAPATANMIGKLAHGLADDYLSTLTLALTCPVIICPSMNTKMWQNSAVRDNLSLLKKRGFFILPPEEGDLACGYRGVGRLTDIVKIESFVRTLLDKGELLKGKKVLVTAGATSNFIDSVRTLSNRASGKMGKHLAQAARQRGAQVLLLRSVSSVSPDYGIKEELFETTEDLKLFLKHYVPSYDIIFHSAAVSDFEPQTVKPFKIKSDKKLNLSLKPATKLIDQIKTWNKKIILIGFKAIHRPTLPEIKKEAKQMIKKSRADYIAVNDISRSDVGFRADDNEIYLLSAKGLMTTIKKQSKKEIAGKLFDKIFGQNK